MPKDDRLYLGHMLDSARQATEKLRGVTRERYDQEENLRLALAYLVQVIGEAATRVSAELRDAHPDIPWRSIVGMRHRIVHDYLRLDVDIVWATVTDDLPVLIRQLEAAVGDTESGGHR